MEDFANPVADCSGLIPATKYFARLQTTNEKGVTREVIRFTTPMVTPHLTAPEVRSVTAELAYLTGDVTPHGFKTNWRFEFATSEAARFVKCPGRQAGKL